MITLYPQERIIRIAHRHWIVIAGKMTSIAALLLLPAIGLIIFSALPVNAFFGPLFRYVVSIYALILGLIAFALWVDYYLDVWVITTHRIIDTEQKGLFRHEMSEFTLDKIQDITTETPSFFAAFLKYGNIKVNTAGETTFRAFDIPQVYEVKNIIIAEAEKMKKGMPSS